MMPGYPDLGPHAAFIYAAYAVMAVSVLGLVIAIVGDDRRQRRLLSQLEARGITRRSAAKRAASSPAKAKPASGAAKTQAKPRSRRKAAPRAQNGAAK